MTTTAAVNSKALKVPQSSSLLYAFSSESVTEGHPDKVCDYIADSILDAFIARDKESRVACEVLCKENHAILAGEVSSRGDVDVDQVARQAIREIGYDDPAEPFCAGTVEITQHLSKQSAEIAQGVDPEKNVDHDQGAGDQGIMFGYATDETAELMPLPILLAHRLSKGLSEDRRSGKFSWLRPDGKTQVSVIYDGNRPVAVSDILVSTQHTQSTAWDTIRSYVAGVLAPRALGPWFDPGIRIAVNPTGSFSHGGPSADCGVTGRKIIVDSYGGAGRHGGGAFSGKDPSKVDRSGAYFCRYIARRLVQEGLAQRAEIQIAYAIGVARPISVKVETFGTGDCRKAEAFVREFDFRPAAIIERLNLLRPIYRQTTNYGHFGRPGLPWEE